jgi:hypothetical protein
MPEPKRALTLEAPDDRIHKSPPDPSARISVRQRLWDLPKLCVFSIQRLFSNTSGHRHSSSILPI